MARGGYSGRGGRRSSPSPVRGNGRGGGRGGGGRGGGRGGRGGQTGRGGSNRNDARNAGPTQPDLQTLERGRCRIDATLKQAISSTRDSDGFVVSTFMFIKILTRNYS